MNVVEKEYIILGAGPAGLQLGALLQEFGHDYCVLERGKAPGEFFRTFPRHRKLISINKVHTGTSDAQLAMRWDWNSLHSSHGGTFAEFSEEYFPSADDYLRYLAAFAERSEVEIHHSTEIVQVSKKGESFELRSAEGCIYKSR